MLNPRASPHTKLWGTFSVVGPAPALSEGTSGVEPAGEAERSTAAKFKALVSWAQGVARHEIEKLPYEGKHVHELPQKGERKPEGPPRRVSAWPRYPHKRASPKSRCRRRAKAKASSSTRWRCHRKGTSESSRCCHKRADANPKCCHYRASEHEVDTPPQGSPNEGKYKRGREARPKCGVHWPPGTLGGGHLEGKSPSRKAVLKSTKCRSAHRHLQQDNT